eukprot:1181832-Prorocentrum_minimum.AAC.2
MWVGETSDSKGKGKAYKDEAAHSTRASSREPKRVFVNVKLREGGERTIAVGVYDGEDWSKFTSKYQTYHYIVYCINHQTDFHVIRRVSGLILRLPSESADVAGMLPIVQIPSVDGQ